MDIGLVGHVGGSRGRILFGILVDVAICLLDYFVQPVLTFGVILQNFRFNVCARVLIHDVRGLVFIASVRRRVLRRGE